MHTLKSWLLCSLCLFPLWLHAADDELGGRLEASTPSGELIQFPALNTDIQVDIQGDLATVQVVQRFENPMNTPLNVSYLFPLNQHAAVYAMQMEVGEERIQAKIDELKAAEKTFKQAQQAGKSAALLKQHRPNMFTQDIANLMPGLPVTVTLEYVQTVPKVDGDYQLVLPLVVGPRFQPPGAGVEPKAGSTTQAVGQWQLEALPKYPKVPRLDNPQHIESERVSIEIQLNAGMPIQKLLSDTHQLNISHGEDKQRLIQLANKRVIDNQDFILRYSLAGADNQAGLLSYHDGEQGFFSLLLEPPALPQAEQINAREMVFVLDCSGSMRGQPMAASKAFMRATLRQLRPNDSFRIIRFSDSATEFSRHPKPATASNIRAGLRYTEQLRGSGGTMMIEGIRQALQVPVPAGSIRLISFLTDGYIGNEATILKLLQQRIGAARLFAIGVGTAPNRFLLDEMGHMGRGFTRYIDPTESVEQVAQELAQRLQSPVLTDIQIDWGDLQVGEVLPQQVPDLFAGQSLRIQGRYRQGGKQQVTIHAQVNGRKASLPLVLDLPENQLNQGQAIPLIWARSAIKERMRLLDTLTNLRSNPDFTDQGLQQQVTELGLKYSLVTRWTAFVAVSEKIYNPNPAQAQSAEVPLPQVQGVGPQAYSQSRTIAAAPRVQAAPSPQNAPQFSGHAAPEPHFLIGLLFIMLVFAGFIWRSGHTGRVSRSSP